MVDLAIMLIKLKGLCDLGPLPFISMIDPLLFFSKQTEWSKCKWCVCGTVVFLDD